MHVTGKLRSSSVCGKRRKWGGDVMRLTRRKGTWIVTLLGLLVAGCGTSKSQQATQQLLISNAVDLSISQMDFSMLSGRSVYLSTKFLVEVGAKDFGKAPYIISSFLPCID